MPPKAQSNAGESAESASLEDFVSRPRKRRRVLACETCRRIKSRCDFNSSVGSCHRCTTLRIPCSLTEVEGAVAAEREPASAHEALETDSALLRELNTKIAAQGRILTELKQIVQGNHSSMSEGTAVNTPDETSTTYDVAPKPPADQNIEIAPVVMIRNVRAKSHGGFERLKDLGPQKLVNLEFLSYSMIIDLLNIYLEKIDPWFQLSTLEGKVFSINKMSSLLIATRCLQGIRYSKLRNTQSHKMLYEHVRKELAPVLLISPLPNDWLQALTLMTLYNMGPQLGRPEFIDSWIMSGHCVQQTMLGVNFTDIVTNIHRSSTSNNDLRALRLWNNACLAHLCFAIGTGRPSIISEAYLNQCSLILDIWNHNRSDDAMILAEIQLYSILLKLLNSPCPISVRGECKEVTDWWGKWVYLTGSDSDRARIFEMNRHFGYVLLYQRSLKNISSSPYRSQTKEATTKRDDECKALISSSVFHASELLHILMRLPCTTVETLPDHLQLAMIYAILILTASYPHESNVATQTPNQVPENVIDSEKVLRTIRAAMAYCKDAKLTPILPAEHAVAQLERRLKSHGETPEPVLSQSQDQQEGTDVFPELDLSLWDPSLPSLEDIFGGGAFIVEGFNETFSL